MTKVLLRAALIFGLCGGTNLWAMENIEKEASLVTRFWDWLSTEPLIDVEDEEIETGIFRLLLGLWIAYTSGE